MDNELRTVEWSIGDRLAKARRLAKMSTREMAEYLGLDRKMINHYESDRTPIRMAYLRLWADRCGVSIEWIIHGNDTTPHEGADSATGPASKNGRTPRRPETPGINGTSSDSPLISEPTAA